MSNRFDNIQREVVNLATGETLILNGSAEEVVCSAYAREIHDYNCQSPEETYGWYVRIGEFTVGCRDWVTGIRPFTEFTHR